MRTRPRAHLLGLAIGLALGIGGASTAAGQGEAVRGKRHEETVAALRKAEASRPRDASVRRRLGVHLLESGDVAGALAALRTARELDPKDRLAAFHLGRAAERAGEIDLAIQSYGAYLPAAGRRTAAVRARIRALSLADMQASLRQAIRDEGRLRIDSIPPNTVAVPEFAVSSGSDTLRPLSRGLAVVMITDLGKVPGLRVLERERLRVLLDELQMGSGASSGVRAETAPRIGKLLGARRFAQGSLVPLPDDRLQLDAVVLDVASGASEPSGSPVNGALTRALELEKTLVFQVIERMGLTVPPEIRREIEKPATRSFPAFLAYSRGLDFELRGLTDQALASYREAVRLDPSFELARTRRDEMLVTALDQTTLDAALASEAVNDRGSQGRLMQTGFTIGLQTIEPWSLSFTPAARSGLTRIRVGGTLQ